MNLDKIKNLLKDISQFEILEIIDNSNLHSNHKGVKELSYPITHVEIRISNHHKLNKVDIHRNVYEKLDNEIKKGLHSIEIKILNN
tara:strand:+ start:567 stop:824 length:258 start_codon:yes stop_codon:yes gene_type:complete